MISGQTDGKNDPQILPQKRLIQKNKNQSKDIEYIKKVPLHPRDRLKHQKKIKQESEVQYIKPLLQHPRDRLSRRLKNRPANIICDEEFLKEFPYFNRIEVNKTDKLKHQRRLYTKSLNRYHQMMTHIMLNTIKILTHIISEKTEKLLL